MCHTDVRSEVESMTSAIGRTLAYLYFLRFSLLLWGVMPLLIVLDALHVSSSVTRVLLTLSDGWQSMFAAGSIVLVGWLAMMLARIVCVYGTSRFGIAPPKILEIEPGTMRMRVLFWAQLPGFLLLAYILWLSLCDAGIAVNAVLSPLHEDTRAYLLLGTLVGISEAALIWFVIAWIYHLLHSRSGEDEAIFEFVLPYHAQGSNIVSAFLRRTLGRAKQQTSPVGDSPSRLLSFTKELGSGYLSFDRKDVGSGHLLAAFVTAGFFLLYLTLAWITFPLPGGAIHLGSGSVLGFIHILLSCCDRLHRWLSRELYGAWVGFLAFAFSLLSLVLFLWRRTDGKRAGICLTVSIICAICWISIAREPHYPAIATILTLLMLFGSGLSGMGFFLDRFRMPAFLALVVLLWGWKRIAPTDHVFVPQAVSQPSQRVPQPSDLGTRFIESKDSADPGGPIIIVTATGGGIHAAYWTAIVLDGLEDSFQLQDPSHHFNNRILLMSSASGGSIAVANWITEHANRNSTNKACPNMSPLTTEHVSLHEAANQSSLEAVAWGLLHTDLWEMLLPIGKFQHDRAWFLEQANLANLYIVNHPPKGRETLDNEYIPENWNQSCFIVALQPEFASTDVAQQLNTPAFSLNATAVETGERFLLSNYTPGPPRAVDAPLGIRPWNPALSFISQYTTQPEGQASTIHSGRSQNYDLEISTAARLSANFPYVSPVSRADVAGNCPDRSRSECGTFHLADGGYYDNDGVATAFEFLWLALGNFQGHVPPLNIQHQRVLLIQIRDGPLPEESDIPTAKDYEDSMSANHAFSQTMAPLKTVYNSWHVSESTRNQRELSALTAALWPAIELRSVEFSFPGNPTSCCGPGDSPGNTTLNWRLTRADQAAIQSEWNNQRQCAMDLAVWSGPEGSKEQQEAENKAKQDCSRTKH